VLSLARVSGFIDSDVRWRAILAAHPTSPPVSVSARIIRFHSPVQKIVVCAVRTHNKVSVTVVRPILVDVMHNSPRRQLIPKDLLDHPDVVKLFDTVYLVSEIPKGHEPCTVGAFLGH
jgi:hypothetical protein